MMEPCKGVVYETFLTFSTAIAFYQKASGAWSASSNVFLALAQERGAGIRVMLLSFGGTWNIMAGMLETIPGAWGLS